ncbi:MAG: hypothetical protein ACXWID_00095 [Pyrinomonadaceae bacterium]
MDVEQAYELIRTQTLLPKPIFDVVEPALAQLGYPLAKSSTTDWDEKLFEFYAGQSQGKTIVLVNMAPAVIGDPSQTNTVAMIANVFLEETDGLYFFAEVKELNRALRNKLAPTYERKKSGPQRVRFFDQGDLDDLATKEDLAARAKLINFLMDADRLVSRMTATNGNGSAEAPLPPPDLTEIQEQLISIILDRFLTAGAAVSDFFINLRDGLGWPPDWVTQWEPKGAAKESARSFVLFLIKQRTYPPTSNKDGYTTVGVLLEELMPQVGGDMADEMYQLVAKYKLIERQDVLTRLKESYCKKP